MSDVVIRAKDLGIRFRTGFAKRIEFKERIQSVLKGKKIITQEWFWALRNLNFEVNDGDIVGIIGGNGAGKSTLLRTVGGIYSPDEGSIEVNRSIATLLALGTGFKEDLNGYENVVLNGVIMGFKKEVILEKAQEIIDYTELGDMIYSPVKYYSSGMKARLGFSIAVHLKKEIMLIDEVLGVGDHKFRSKSQEKMSEIVHDGRTVLIVSHNLQSIEKYANKCLWIHKGQQMMFGETSQVIDAYLKS